MSWASEGQYSHPAIYVNCSYVQRERETHTHAHTKRERENAGTKKVQVAGHGISHQQACFSGSSHVRRLPLVARLPSRRLVLLLPPLLGVAATKQDPSAQIHPPAACPRTMSKSTPPAERCKGTGTGTRKAQQNCYYSTAVCILYNPQPVTYCSEMVAHGDARQARIVSFSGAHLLLHIVQQ